MTKDKFYFSKTELIDVLYNEKKIKRGSIPDVVFDEASYNEIFRSYADFLCVGVDLSKGKRNYPQETDFDDVIQWVKADQACSMVLHVYIGNFERRIRSFVINEYCERMKQAGDAKCRDINIIKRLRSGESNDLHLLSVKEYLDSHFLREDAKGHRPAKITGTVDGSDKTAFFLYKALDDLEECYGSEKEGKSELELHYKKKYGYIPAFVGMCDLSFSTTTFLFSLLPYERQKYFWNTYKKNTRRFDQTEDYLSQQRKLRTLVNLRNAINHYEPLFPKLVAYEHKNITALCSVFLALEKNNQTSLSSYKIAFSSPILPENKNPSMQTQYDDLLRLISCLFPSN